MAEHCTNFFPLLSTTGDVMKSWNLGSLSTFQRSELKEGPVTLLRAMKEEGLVGSSKGEFIKTHGI